MTTGTLWQRQSVTPHSIVSGAWHDVTHLAVSAGAGLFPVTVCDVASNAGLSAFDYTCNIFLESSHSPLFNNMQFSKIGPILVE